MEDEGVLKIKIERYQQRIFAFVLYLIGGDKDKTYDVAVASFVEAIQSTSVYGKEDVFLIRLAGVAIQKSRAVKVIPYFDESDFMNLPADKRKSLFMVRRALHLLPFETKALLLLRDQLHIPYKNIATILRISPSDARSQTMQAQIRFREKMKEVLSDAG